MSTAGLSYLIPFILGESVEVVKLCELGPALAHCQVSQLTRVRELSSS